MTPSRLQRLLWWIEARPALHRPVRLAEAFVFGTRLREKALTWLLQHHYLSRFRRRWHWNATKPHFEDNRAYLGLWPMRRWHLSRNPDVLSRGFLNRELLFEGCRVLDIGCGDGLFDYLFYSALAASIDAIDIDPEAIRAARRQHSAPNITYHLADCVAQEFPAPRYDVVFWDGAIAHFSESAAAVVLARIARALDGRGVLAGSESLEPKDARTWDHQLVFSTPEEIRAFLQRYFPFVVVKEVPALLGRYREVCFRCGYAREALAGRPWT